MEHPATLIICAAIGYLLGSILGAPVVSRMLHTPDPWQHGSRNPGATNMYRLGGWVAAVGTLLWDALKGALAVGLGAALGLDPDALGMVGISAVMGHMLPAFYKFQGGKGVATVLGCGLVLAPATTLILTTIWGTIVAIKRVSSIASLAAALAAPWVAWWLDPDFFKLFAFLSLFIIVRHRENIISLAKGEERAL